MAVSTGRGGLAGDTAGPYGSRRGDGAPVLLALRALGLGDLLTAVPALRGLRRRYLEHHLVLATPSWLHPLVRLVGCVDECLPAAGLDPLRWPVGQTDVAVNLHGRGPQSHRLLGQLRPTELVAFATLALPTVAGPPWVDDEHEVRRWCRLVASTGAAVDPEDLGLCRAAVASPAPGAVVVHPGAAYGSRRWPADRFARVARDLSAGGREVVVTGSAAEVPLARRVAAQAGLPPSSVLAGANDVIELAALVADAALVLCGDTGVGHLASAYGTPSVLLFGPTPPERWGPPPRPQHRVLWPGATRSGSWVGDPWGTAPDPALLRIDVAEVSAAVDLLLDAPAPTGSRCLPAPNGRASP